MKYNNEYTNFINKLDTNDEFKKNLIEKIKEEEFKKGMIKMKIKNKITAIIASLGIITCSGIAYATLVPEEVKQTINNKISTFFGIETNQDEESEYDVGIQEETLEQVLESNKENLEDYSELTDPTMYGLGDSNGGSLIETNYEQYDWNVKYDEEGNILEKDLKNYDKTINIKLGQINHGCLEKIDRVNTILDENGTVIERKELTIEEMLKYQYDEFNTNWDNYYHGQEEADEELYFEITGMLIMNGNNKTEEDYYNNARAKKIKITFDGKEEKIINVVDTKEAQYIDLQYVHYDISKPVDISIEVLEKFDGKENNALYIADIQFGISSNVPMGR